MICSKFQIICIPRFQIIQILNVLKFLQKKQHSPFWLLTYGHWLYLHENVNFDDNKKALKNYPACKEIKTVLLILVSNFCYADSHVRVMIKYSRLYCCTFTIVFVGINEKYWKFNSLLWQNHNKSIRSQPAFMGSSYTTHLHAHQRVKS